MNWAEIHDAISNEDVGRLAVLLSRRKTLWNDYFAIDHHRSIPPPYLHMAASSTQHGDEMIRILVKAGMNVNVQDKKERTALLTSLENLQPLNHDSTMYVVTTLLELYCDPCAPDESGKTALHILANKASSNNCNRFIKKLLSFIDEDEKSIFVTSRDRTGQTALHALAIHGRQTHDLNGFVDILISCVPENERITFLNGLDSSGNSAMYYAAASNSSLSMVSKLLELSANPFVPNQEAGRSILHASLCHRDHNNKDVTRRAVVDLLGRGCDPRAQDDETGRTALHILAINSCQEHDLSGYIDILISYVPENEKTTFLNITDNHSNSALYHAAQRSGSIGVVCKLLELSADPEFCYWKIDTSQCSASG